MRSFLTSILLLLAIAGGVLAVVPRAWIASPINPEPRWMMASGFVNDHLDVGPWTWAWSRYLDLRLDHPSETNVIIWNHHTEAMQSAPSCLGTHYYPPPAIMALENLGRTRVYYLCTRSRQDPDKPHFAIQRRDEILALIAQLRASGVPAGRIFLSGQSGGSCASLFALGEAADQMNAGILFAPACHGQGEGAKRTNDRQSRLARDLEKKMLSAKKVTALLVGFQNDAWNKPKELRFLTERWPDTARLYSPRCGANHSGAFYGCGVSAVGKAVEAYFIERLQAAGYPAPVRGGI